MALEVVVDAFDVVEEAAVVETGLVVDDTLLVVEVAAVVVVALVIVDTLVVVVDAFVEEAVVVDTDGTVIVLLRRKAASGSLQRSQITPHLTRHRHPAPSCHRKFLNRHCS